MDGQGIYQTWRKRFVIAGIQPKDVKLDTTSRLAHDMRSLNPQNLPISPFARPEFYTLVELDLSRKKEKSGQQPLPLSGEPSDRLWTNLVCPLHDGCYTRL